MAEALAAFGLACNVMQVIGCAIDICHVYHVMSEKGSVDPLLASKSDSLRVLSDDLGNSISDGSNNPHHSVQDRKRCQELRKIAKDCQETSEALLQELLKIAPRSQSPFHKATASVKAFWHGSKISRMEKEMKSCEDTMTSKIMVHLFTRAEAAQVQQQAGFAQLNSILKDFIVQYSNGYTKLQDLLAAQSVQTIESLRNENAKLDRSMQLVVHSSAKETVSSINKHAETNFSNYRDTVDGQEAIKRLFKSLKYESMNQRKNQINQAYRSSLYWALSSDSLIREWLVSNGKFFWITGKAGSGKSTLMKFLIHQPQTLEFLCQNREDAMILSYFHWSAGGPDQSSFHSLLCSLVLQTLQVNTDTLTLLNKNQNWKWKDTPWDWSTEELEATLHTMITSSSHSFCLIIDGLDEFRDDDGAVVLVEFLMRLSRLDSIRLLVSSRPEQYFVNKLEKSPNLYMEDMTKEDIAKMVTDKMTKCVEEIRQRKTAARQKFNISDKTVAQIEKTLIRMADGVFLWVHFALLGVLDGLENDDDAEDLLARLENTPRKLEDLYSDMLARTSPVYHRYAGRVFHIILELPLLEMQLETRYGKLPGVRHHQTILTFAAILENAKLHSILKTSRLADAADEIELLCQSAAKAVVTKSSGPAEVKRRGRTDTANQKDTVMMIRVELIHQTARSFLEGLAGKQILQAGTISKADILKGLLYSGLALMVMNKVDRGYRWSGDRMLHVETWNILCSLSYLLPYDEWVPLTLLLYHIRQQCGKYPTIRDFFFRACDNGFYKLIKDLLEGQIQLVERNGDATSPRPDFAYKKSFLLSKVLSSTLSKQGLFFFMDISTTLKDSISLARYLLENGADPNEPQGYNGNEGTPLWCFVKRLNHCTNDCIYRESKHRESGRQDLLAWLAEMVKLLTKHGGNFTMPLLTMWQIGGVLGGFGPPFLLMTESSTYRVVVFEDSYVSLVKAVYLTLQESSTALQADHVGYFKSLFDPTSKRRPVLVAKVPQDQLKNLVSTADSPIEAYSRGSWLGELARLGYVHLVPVDQDQETFTKLDSFIDPNFLPHSKEKIQCFKALVERSRTSPGDENERSSAILRALEAGQICEPNTSSTTFGLDSPFAFDPLSTGLKFFVPPHSGEVVESCTQKAYHFDNFIYDERDLNPNFRMVGEVSGS
ncbi:hypothetical protein V8E51_003005 [Hyaloscypha variabilis]